MQKGLIISNVSNIYNVQVENKVYECTARGKFKKNEIVPLVGDKVEISIIDEEKNTAVIDKVLDRINYLKRPKIANLTQIVLVVAMEMPKPDLLLLDKQLAYVNYMGIKPIICLNKIDLDMQNLANEIKSVYEKIGYTVIKTNAKTGEGIVELKQYLKNNLTAFSGNSGVGKSTLINGIFEREITEEGLVSQRIKRGKNTTTIVKLYKIEENTYIADTPGFSTFDIYTIPYKELARYYIDFEKYLEECEYMDCRHILEKKCGIKNAVEEGKIDKSRYERFIKIYNDMKEKEDYKW